MTTHASKMFRANQERAKKVRAKPKLWARPAVPAPPGGAVPPVRENPIMGISRNMVAVMHPEALIALRSVRDWKSSEAVRRAHGDLASYHDVLTELHAAGTIKFKGEDFMMGTTKKDGADYGLEMHAKWVRAGRPGRFSDFLKSEQEKAKAAAQDQAKAGGGR